MEPTTRTSRTTLALARQIQPQQTHTATTEVAGSVTAASLVSSRRGDSPDSELKLHHERYQKRRDPSEK